MIAVLLYLSLLFAPYSAVNCSQFVCAPHRAHCTAAQLYDGCDGRLTQVAVPRRGDVIAYNRAHVAVYISTTLVLDSTPEHGVSLHKIPANDRWYQDASI